MANLPVKASQEYADLLPEGKILITPEATHFPFVEKPEEFSQAVAVFLSKE
ncbi:MAG: alpha/beta hydrolase [Candidatus Aminicenantaceae bacterium]